MGKHNIGARIGPFPPIITTLAVYRENSLASLLLLLLLLVLVQRLVVSRNG